MSEEQYFLEAINASEPNVDLIYADWLEEQGRSEADEIRDPIIVSLPEWSQSSSNSRSFSWSGRHSWSGSLFYSSLQSVSCPRSRSRSSYRPRFCSQSQLRCQLFLRVSRCRSWSTPRIR